MWKKEREKGKSILLVEWREAEYPAKGGGRVRKRQKQQTRGSIAMVVWNGHYLFSPCFSLGTVDSGACADQKTPEEGHSKRYLGSVRPTDSLEL